ncbi:MAG: DNA repair exonuclease [Lachnospiraceae bacterium]|nr:DNA repair exonuclease [Lachnospiraceae bacterium]
MKIIHCADLHLDSRMTTNLDPDRAKERKIELLNTFGRMVSYAAEHDVRAILIAGDLFDTNAISARARNYVKDRIEANPDILFFYLKGNHDANDSFTETFESIPENLKLFSDTWTQYELEDGRIVIYGIELTKENAGSAFTTLLPAPEPVNIVMLHGQAGEYRSKNTAESIDLSALRNRNIDYLALGHVHEIQEQPLPPRGKMRYPGCLEGRGFDECGTHGFWLLDIDTNNSTITDEFIPAAYRTLYEIHVDCAGTKTSPEILERCRDAILKSGATERDLLKLVWDGAVDIDCEKSPEFVASQLRDEHYFLKIYDRTQTHVNYEDYALDASLKGEFVRAVKADETLSDEEKAEIIRCGIRALGGEEIAL